MKISKKILLLHYLFFFQLSLLGAVDNHKDSFVKFFTNKVLIEAGTRYEESIFYEKQSFSKEKTANQFEDYKTNLFSLYTKHKDDNSIFFKDNCYNPLTISFLLLAAHAISDKSPQIFSFLERTNLVSNKISLDRVKLRDKNEYNEELFIDLTVLDKKISKVPYLILNGLPRKFICGQVIHCFSDHNKSDLIKVLAQHYTTHDDIDYFQNNCFEGKFYKAYSVIKENKTQDFLSNVRLLIETAQQYRLEQKTLIIQDKKETKDKNIIEINEQTLLPEQKIINGPQETKLKGEQNNEDSESSIKKSSNNKPTFFSTYKYHIGIGAIFIGLFCYIFWQQQNRNNQT